jgi:mannitol/fructose-specific phosphotransferase system IIA component (Ntr-type)
MNICGLLQEEHIFFDLKPGDKNAVLADFVQALKRRSLISDDRAILQELLARERLGSTGLEKGIAIPHALTDEIEESFLALAVIREGTEYEAIDQMPTYVLLMLLGNSERPGVQLKVLAHVCRLVKETDVIGRIRDAESGAEACRILREEEAKIG